MAERERPRARIAISIATAAVAVGIVTTIVTVCIVWRLHVPLPYWDEWSTIIDFDKVASGTYSLDDLAGQHNEHRLLFPRLFFFADEALFGLSGVLNTTVSLLLQLANAAILIHAMTRLVARPAHRALLAGFVLLLLFTLAQEQNFTNGFQLQFIGVFTAAALAGMAYAAALTRLRTGRGRTVSMFALAALGCFVSTYSMANGVLAGPVLVVAAVLSRAPWPVPVGTALLSVALSTLFFHGYLPGGSSYGAADALSHAWAYPRFFTAFLGNSLALDLRAAQALGVVGLLLAAGAAWRVATDPAPEPAKLVLLILVGFILATDAATTYGRIASGTGQAFESRYVTPSLLFWTALVLIWFPVVFRPGANRLPAWLLSGLMLLLATTALVAEATAWPALADRSTAVRRVADSLVSGLYDVGAAETYENTSPDEVAARVPFLRLHRLAAFADPVVAALGRPLSVLGPVAAPSDCGAGATARADPTLGARGVRLDGTMRHGAIHWTPNRVVVTDAAGTILGFGSAGLPGQPSRLWSAYAVAGPGDALQAFARLHDGTFCSLGGSTVE